MILQGCQKWANGRRRQWQEIMVEKEVSRDAQEKDKEELEVEWHSDTKFNFYLFF
jgi:hypothetical protein